MKNQERFLEFNGENIAFISKDDIYHIAMKPLCEALKVDYIRCFKNAKNDPILGSVLSEQTIQVSKNGKKQGRKMTCIPEEFIYGWLFSLRSESEDLINYKRECYRLLYKYFHGKIGSLKDVLVEKKKIESQIKEIKNIIRVNDPIQKELLSLQLKAKELGKKANQITDQYISDSELFPSE